MGEGERSLTALANKRSSVSARADEPVDCPEWDHTAGGFCQVLVPFYDAGIILGIQ